MAKYKYYPDYIIAMPGTDNVLADRVMLLFENYIEIKVFIKRLERKMISRSFCGMQDSSRTMDVIERILEIKAKHTRFKKLIVIADEIMHNLSLPHAACIKALLVEHLSVNGAAKTTSKNHRTVLSRLHKAVKASCDYLLEKNDEKYLKLIYSLEAEEEPDESAEEIPSDATPKKRGRPKKIPDTG